MSGYAVIYSAALARGLSDRTAHACDAVGGLLVAAAGRGDVGVDDGGKWVSGAGAIASLTRTYCMCAGVDAADVVEMFARVMSGGDLSDARDDGAPAASVSVLAMYALRGGAPADLAPQLVAVASDLARRAAEANGDDPSLAAAALTDGLLMIEQGGDGKPN